MAGLPTISGKEAIKAFQNAGWAIVRTGSSRHISLDALHVACAQKAKVDFFITCDDNLLKKLKRIDTNGLKCYNIIDFISKEVFKR